MTMSSPSKYAAQQLVIPQEKRASINDKILYLITNDLVVKTGITAADIYNSFTGAGGLHGLACDDFANYNDYAEAKKEIEQGRFFTAPEICQCVVDCIRPCNKDIIYDMTCGMGRFFNYLPQECNIYGVDNDLNALKVAKFLFPRAKLSHEDIRSYHIPVAADIVIGNPPYNLKWAYRGTEASSQFFYCLKAAEALKPGGLFAAIMPEQFMADEWMDQKQIAQMNEMFNFIVQFDLPHNAFAYLDVKSFHTKVMIFQRRSANLLARPYNADKELNTNSEYIFSTYIQPLAEQREQIRAKLILENSRQNSVDKVLNDTFTKLLFDIGRHPRSAIHLGRCESYINKFITQVQPDGMSWEEWQKVRITEQKVLAMLKNILSNVNRIYRDERRVIKTNGSFFERDYSEDNQDQELGGINSHVLDEDASIPGYDKLLRHKRNEYRIQSQPFEDMPICPRIKAYIENWVAYSCSEERCLALNGIQSADVNKLLQKRYGMLQYEMGSGKTLCGLVMIMYLLENAHIHNVFIVSDALSINNTWSEVMQDYNIPFYRIARRADCFSIPEKSIVLITLDMLTKLRKELKRFVRLKSQKVGLFFDESDAITSLYSGRTKAMLMVFRRCRYKYLATGTSTRNSITEIAPQLELMYNNSINYLSWAECVYTIDKRGDEQQGANVYWGKPIPAYRKGYTHFAESHLPKRITVFGVEQFTQDVLNADTLKELLAKTIITKTFEEVAGRKIHDIQQIMVPFHQAEKEVYTRVIKEFHEMRWKYFSTTGNSRKDSMFRILQQLLLLLKACADPAHIDGYGSTLPATKVSKMLELLRGWENERVAIGVRHVEVAHAYASYIRMAFPDRPLFIITGGESSFKKRREVVKELEATTNGILLSTQQAYSKSQSIDFVDKIILPELHYNNAAMSQYYFRFIRYTSTRHKQVVFLTYANSIESNLVRMIMAKEKLNLFMKEQDVDDDELFERFGADRELVQMLMTREKDEDGNVNIRWGEQEIS